jgi:putative tryptophan/tyrosine transport system substrate-binding protein
MAGPRADRFDSSAGRCLTPPDPRPTVPHAVATPLRLAAPVAHRSTWRVIRNETPTVLPSARKDGSTRTMERRRFLATLASGMLAAPVVADAQQAGKVAHLGVLSGGRRDITPAYRFLPKTLRELGYVEGQSLIIEWRFADGNVGRLPELAADLVRSKVDIIVTTFMSEIHAARQATTSIPIVMAQSVDPVANGLVVSLAKPGGNITGMTIQPPEFGGKQVELLKQAVPQLSRLAVVWDLLYPGFKPFYEHAEIAARTLGITLQSIEVRQPGDIDVAFARITKEHFQGLAVWPTNVMGVNMKRILDFASQNRLPTIYPTRAFMDVGGLMSYSTNYDEVYRRIAVYIDKILKGTKPADLPVEQPTKYELLINLKEAKALGLTIPPSLLLRADEVIQ